LSRVTELVDEITGAAGEGNGGLEIAVDIVVGNEGGMGRLGGGHGGARLGATCVASRVKRKKGRGDGG